MHTKIAVQQRVHPGSYLFERNKPLERVGIGSMVYIILGHTQYWVPIISVENIHFPIRVIKNFDH